HGPSDRTAAVREEVGYASHRAMPFQVHDTVCAARLGSHLSRRRDRPIWAMGSSGHQQCGSDIHVMLANSFHAMVDSNRLPKTGSQPWLWSSEMSVLVASLPNIRRMVTFTTANKTTN